MYAEAIRHAGGSEELVREGWQAYLADPGIGLQGRARKPFAVFASSSVWRSRVPQVPRCACGATAEVLHRESGEAFCGPCARRAAG